MHILLIGSDQDHLEQLRLGLKAHNYAVDMAAADGEGAELAESGDFDVIINLAKDDPYQAAQVSRRIRKKEVAEPILVVAEEADTQDRVDILDAGADDVVDEECEFREVLARLRALLRRCQPTENALLTYKDVEVDLPRLRAVRAGKVLQINGKTLALLEFFLRRPERVLSREEIGKSVWDSNFDPYSNVIDVTVSKLRQVLDKPFDTPYVHTVVRGGYMLNEKKPGEG